MTSTDTKRAAFLRLNGRPIPRVQRMMHVAEDLGYDCTYYGAHRDEGLARTEVENGLKIERTGPFFPLLNGKSPLTYIGGILGYNRGAFRALRRDRPHVVHASDIETMPAAFLYKLSTRRTRLIYNIHDNLSQRYTPPALISALMNFAEGIAVRIADTTLVPEAFRRDSLPRFARSKVKVVRNTPRDKGVAPLPEPGGPIRLFFGGWLDLGRGLQQLLDLVRDNEDFELTVAGEGDASVLASVHANPRTRFLGFVSHDEIMEETARCHFVSALYDPVRPINRFAASNKLAEALSRGRPALVNTEMLITEDIAPFDALLALPYADIPTQAADAMRDAVQPARYAELCTNARTAYEAMYGWDDAVSAMREAFVG